MKFKVGDIITGNKSADHKYSYTTSRAIMKVVGVNHYKDTNKYEIDVCIMSHETTKKCVGRTYLVNPGHFILVKPVAKSNYIEIGEE